MKSVLLNIIKVINMNKIKGRIIAIFIVLTVMISISTSVVVYIYTTSTSNEIIDFWKKETDFWEAKYNLSDDAYHNIEDKFSDLEYDFYDLTNDYNDLVDEFNSLYSPCTLIKDGEINWRFDKLDDTIATWTVDIDTYRGYVMIAEPTEYKSLYNSGTGETYYVKDLTQYVQPDFFSGVISDLTNGNSAREFVSEVVNLKNQLITYGSGLGDFYRWSAETLTEGRGQCGDTSILIASLLKAGEDIANYGLDVYFWYCDSDYMNNPQDVDHVIVGVEYSDGGYELIETTTDEYYTYDEIVGWNFEI
jgi:hypothetical protein